MVNKLTRDDVPSSSGVCYMFDEGRFMSKTKLLNNQIKAKHGINTRTPQTNRQRTGDVLEPVLITEACNRLGLINVQNDITEKVVHPFLPLQASLDGLAEADNLVLKNDHENGIYLPSMTKVCLNGIGVIEVKCSSDYPSDPPPLWLGVLQLQSSMEIMDADWGLLIVLFQSTDLRMYIYKRNPEFAGQLKEKVEDWNRRIIEEDYFEPVISADASIIYDRGDQEEELILPAEIGDLVEEMDNTKQLIKKLEETADNMQALIMSHMGNHSKARVNDYTVEWKSRTYKGTEEVTKTTPAKPERSVRNKSITIKRAIS